jgi:hypothetical protein
MTPQQPKFGKPHLERISGEWRKAMKKRGRKAQIQSL